MCVGTHGQEKLLWRLPTKLVGDVQLCMRKAPVQDPRSLTKVTYKLLEDK